MGALFINENPSLSELEGLNNLELIEETFNIESTEKSLVPNSPRTKQGLSFGRDAEPLWIVWKN
jgi:hypothetical protein